MPEARNPPGSAPGLSDAAARAVAPAERRVLEALDVDSMLELLAGLVALPSTAGRETPAQERVAAWMEEAGLATDVWEIDFEALRRHPAYTAEVEREGGLGVVGTLGDEPEDGGRTLVLNGHVDVVPAGEADRWTRPPWRASIEDGRVYGRGTADMKGGLCCALAAVRAIRASGVRMRGPVKIQSVIGEEDGGAGTLAAILRGHLGDGAVVLEPTRLAVAPAQAGALNFRVTVPGRAAHGAFREEGVDPIEKFFPLFRRLRELEAERNREVSDPLFAGEALPFALAIGKLEAGIWASTVAESLTFEGRLGVAPDEEPASARRALERAVAEAAAEDPWLREHPPTVEWWGAQFEPARTPADSPIVAVLGSAYRAVTGSEPDVRGMRYGADMRLLVHQGSVPTVLFGPGDVREAHRPDESVPIDELETAARVLAVAALRFCGLREA